jgi:hypothetical protein
MFIPQKDERCLVCPANPNEPVQRGPNTFGQFLQNGWQEVVFNDFLRLRLLDGSVICKPIPKPEEAPKPVIEPIEAPTTRNSTRSARNPNTPALEDK